MIRMFRKYWLSSLFCACLLCTLQAAETENAQENNNEQQQDELVISADRMEMQLDGKTVELTGNVRIEDADMSLTALKMMVYLTEAEKGGDKAKPKEGETPKEEIKEKNAFEEESHTNMKLQRIEAEGEVKLRKLDGTESAMGDHAVYDVKDDTIIMTGNCSIIQGKNSMDGDKVVYDRKKAKINIQRPRLTIQIDKKGGKAGGAFGNIFSDKDDKDDKDNKDDAKSEDKPKEDKNVEVKPKEDKNVENKPKEDKNVEIKQNEDKKEKRGFWTW